MDWSENSNHCIMQRVLQASLESVLFVVVVVVVVAVTVVSSDGDDSNALSVASASQGATSYIRPAAACSLEQLLPW